MTGKSLDIAVEEDMANADVIVLFNEELNKERRESLSQNLGDLNGVVSVKLPDQLPHLMIVGYNLETAKSSQVLEGVKSSGVNAQLVGWL